MVSKSKVRTLNWITKTVCSLVKRHLDQNRPLIPLFPAPSLPAAGQKDEAQETAAERSSGNKRLQCQIRPAIQSTVFAVVFSSPDMESFGPFSQTHSNTELESTLSHSSPSLPHSISCSSILIPSASSLSAFVLNTSLYLPGIRTIASLSLVYSPN